MASRVTGPSIGSLWNVFDTYLRVGNSNLRWMNQVSVLFARNGVQWDTEDNPDCVYPYCDHDDEDPNEWITTTTPIPVFVQVMFTTGFELNTNPRGDFGFLWELGVTGGGWQREGGHRRLEALLARSSVSGGCCFTTGR